MILCTEQGMAAPSVDLRVAAIQQLHPNQQFQEMYLCAMEAGQSVPAYDKEGRHHAQSSAVDDVEEGRDGFYPANVGRLAPTATICASGLAVQQFSQDSKMNRVLLCTIRTVPMYTA